MSTELAIAAVTAALHHKLGTLVGVKVTVWPPDVALDKFDPNVATLNLFLYQITPNLGWRNVGLPARDSQGAAVSYPPLAIDLHYLLSAYATDDFVAEILLGKAMHLLHEEAVLTRAELNDVHLPPIVAASGLAKQVELVKVTPKALGMEDMSHIWSSLQTHYRPSVAYHASVVLIESSRPVRVAPPVEQPLVYVEVLRAPRIERIGSRRPSGSVNFGQPIVPGDSLIIRGEALKADNVDVVIAGITVSQADRTVTDTEIVAVLPPTLRAGPQTVQVKYPPLQMGSPPKPHDIVESDIAAFVLRPVATLDPPPAPGTIRIAVKPMIGRDQRVALLLTEDPPTGRKPHAYRGERPPSKPIDPPEAGSLDIKLSEWIPGGVKKGTYFARVEVDGTVSAPTVDPLDPTVVKKLVIH